ncbi:hypothetical protein LEQ06_18840 [Paraclostridium sp. AKS46]|nr:hypothetical protein [Paraclostridium sp. AKS46]
MKKLLFLLCLMMVFTVGCSKEVVENRVEVEKTIPSGVEGDIGKGSIIVTTMFQIQKMALFLLYIEMKKRFGTSWT